MECLKEKPLIKLDTEWVERIADANKVKVKPFSFGLELYHIVIA